MIGYFAAHKTAANLLMAAFIVAGLVFVQGIKRETFPDIPPVEVEVSVIHPGAAAEEVEKSICRRIEDAAEKVKDVAEIRCDARENRGTATLKMVEGKNFDRFLNEIKTEVEAIDNFPDEAEAPTIRQLGLTDFVAAIAVTGPMSAPHLKAYAQSLKDEMLQRRIASQIRIGGFSDHQIRIEVSAQGMRQYGLSVDDIAGVIGRQSIDLPAGTLETKARDLLIRFADERRRPLEFGDLVVVGAKSGAEVRLGDIATITDRFETAEDKVIFNGRRAAILEITKTKTEDTLRVIDAVKRFLDEKRLTAPPGVGFEITRDISSIVRDRLDLLVKNGLQGLLLVLLTLWLFFSLRFSFWVAMGFPVSFMGAITMMALVGLSFDMISMVGMLIAVGLLVDDAIVIAENIAAHAKRGATPLRAAIDGARQVAPGVLASYATTVCVFGSLAFLKGDIGAMLKVMPIILIATLSVSLVEAFLILPHHISTALAGRGDEEPSAVRARLERGIDWLRDRPLAVVLGWTIRWRYLAVGLILMIFIASVAMLAGGVLKFRAFPAIEGDVVEARLLMPQGTPLARTAEIVAGLTDALQGINKALTPAQPGGQTLVRNVNIQFNRNIDAHEQGPHIATVTADLLGTEQRTVSVDSILNRWRESAGRPAGVIALKFTEPTLGPAGRPIDIRLSGDDLADLKAAALELTGWLRAYEGIQDLSDDLRPGKPELRLRLKSGATALGLNAQTIATQLRSAFFGRTAAEIQARAEAYEVDVRLGPGDKNSLADLEYFTVTAAGGAQVPLGAVAHLESGRGFARIHRIDRRRTVSLQGEVDTARANVAEIIADTQARFLPGLIARHPGLGVTFQGEAREGEQTGGSVRNGFLLGLVGVFLLLCFLFGNYSEPLVVMFIIPLGLIGVIWGHLAMGLDLSMPSMVGFASLAGVVVNNAILMVTFIRIERQGGASVAVAAHNAAMRRFRAILLTSATTIMGLLPLMTEKSLQAQVLVPLVTSLAFGLLAATLLVMIVVPALYTILDDFGLAQPVETGAQATA